MRYHAKRHYAWSANIAYCVGLMTSDGCLQRDGRHLDITSVDYEQLVNFRVALGRPDLHISRKLSGSDRLAYRIQFSDVVFYDFLVKLGLTPAKSKTIGRLDIPPQYYSDFLRGLFDGDGTVYGYRDSRWKSSYMFYTGFASASSPFLEYIRDTNSKLLHIGNGSVRNSARAACLYYAKNDSLKLYAAMYADPACICLSRKRDKLTSFITSSRLL